MFIVLLTLLPLFIPSASAQEDCPINYGCNNTNIPNSEVEVYCGKHDTNMTGRCCIFKNTIIGLDLRYCDVKILNISQPAFSQIEILDLRDNEYEKVTTHEYLPQHIPCPGGHFSWNITNKDHNMTSCIEQLNPCLSLNISCGDAKNAECHHLGPGTANYL
ncbi:all-trans retinoic acid-induced differentiation factor [Caerostris extrusa]|uniref:All-trans retinoic acid-induced differentiation factor n=1 Tax=Caerostris extrusa TaxID=172846 RepID=A0AAV4XD81_CAEEX|nr:all-trans retinoic acid-induced differentiation factor [Caerostris extrusa]